MAVLLDSNVLIALLVADHVHHDAAERWFEGLGDQFATCPITEGSAVRLLVREGQAAQIAIGILQAMSQHRHHEFWPDDLEYAEVDIAGVVGHRQVTDAYLAQLARRRSGRVATFDAGFASLHVDVAELVPS